MSKIENFQERFAFVNLDDGTLTPEALRALRNWFTRIGGFNGLGSDDLALLGSFAPPDAALAEMSRRIDALQLQLEQLQSPAAAIAEVRQYAQALEIGYSFVSPLVDWESPGRIGARKANSGQFTTLDASGAVTLNPASANVTLSPTGTGIVTINPATTGAADNINIGLTTPRAARVTTLNKVTVTVPASGSTLTIADGKTLTNSNTLTLTATDGATLAIGGGGTLGSAAYTSAGAYAAAGGNAAQAFAASTITTASGTLHITSVALTNGAGAALGTLTTAPTAGPPTKWILINDNGTVRAIPAW